MTRDNMRLLIIPATQPKLFASGDWLDVARFVEANKDRGWFYIVLPPNSEYMTHELPRTTMYRSDAGDAGSYYHMVDLAKIFHVDYGRNVIDSALTCTPQQALTVDLATNNFSFAGTNPYGVHPFVWHQMFWAHKDKKWVDISGRYRQIFLGEEELQNWKKRALEMYRPSVVQEMLTRTYKFPCFPELHKLRSSYPWQKKREKLTFLFGSRMNVIHGTVKISEAMRKLYEAGFDGEFVITTQDQTLDAAMADVCTNLGITPVLGCGRDKFLRILSECHVLMMGGIAAGATQLVEAMAFDVVPVAENLVWLDCLPHDYWNVWETPDQLYTMLRNLWKNWAAEKKKFDDWDPWAQIQKQDAMVVYHDMYDAIRNSVTYMRSGALATSNRRRRFLSQFASMGGDATLAEIVKSCGDHGIRVTESFTGRWITRKLIHSVLVSHPAVTDLCDGPEPHYVLDKEVWREDFEASLNRGEDDDGLEDED